MSYSITGTTITLTRGDTFEALVSATKKDGTIIVTETKTFSEDGLTISTDVVYG